MLSSLLKKQCLLFTLFGIAGGVPAFAEDSNDSIVSWRSEANAALRERLGITEKSICRYLDFDGDGTDEVLFPAPIQIDPDDRRYATYGIARRNAAGTWELIKKENGKDDSPENLKTFCIHNAEDFVEFSDPSAFSTKRVFTLRHPRYGLENFYSLEPEGIVTHTRRQILLRFSVGEFAFLKRIKVLRERDDASEPSLYSKLCALRLTAEGCISVYGTEDTSSISWTWDTLGGAEHATDIPLISFPTRLRERIAGVILRKGEERLLGILFDEGTQVIPGGYLYCTKPGGERLMGKLMETLELYTFSEKRDEKILTEFFPDDGRICEGTPLRIIWFDLLADDGITVISEPFAQQRTP